MLIFLIVIVCLNLIIIDELFPFTFLFVEYNLHRLKDPQQYPQIQFKTYFKNFWSEIFHINGKYYLYPYKFLDMTENVATSSKAILLIHGYRRNQSDWLWFIKQLSEITYPIYTVNLNPKLAPIQQITETSISSKIKEIKSQTNCQEIILIGHSMGGLVASYYSEFLDQDNLVTNVMTIATPFSGTKISVLAPGENGKQMLPDANFAQELRSKIAKSSKKYYQIASQFDNLVFPWQSALLESSPKTQQLVLDSAAHLSMLHIKSVTAQIVTWLKNC